MLLLPLVLVIHAMSAPMGTCRAPGILPSADQFESEPDFAASRSFLEGEVPPLNS